MQADVLNRAIVVGLADSAIPRIDRNKITQEFGDVLGPQIADVIEGLVKEAASTHIEWGSKTLREGVEEILDGIHRVHPELSPEALHEIGRCVGWQLR